MSLDFDRQKSGEALNRRGCRVAGCEQEPIATVQVVVSRLKDRVRVGGVQRSFCRQHADALYGQIESMILNGRAP